MISIKNLYVKYEKNDVLIDVSIDINENKLIAIIGKNGCGKTTLIKSTANQINYQGQIIIDDKETYDLKEFAKTISYMPQSREIAELDVISLVKLARFAYKENQEITLDFAKNAISKLELEKYMYKSVSKLSYGERQKVYLAMLLAQDSKYMLLDEPTSFLDVDAKFYMWDLLKSLENKTRIVVTHDLLDAITFCDELIIIKDEKIIAYDSVDTILKNKIIEDVFDIDIEITNKKYFLKGKKKR
jgi:iron complex transport system ATP-binding protein